MCFLSLELCPYMVIFFILCFLLALRINTCMIRNWHDVLLQGYNANDTNNILKSHLHCFRHLVLLPMGPLLFSFVDFFSKINKTFKIQDEFKVRPAKIGQSPSVWTVLKNWLQGWFVHSFLWWQIFLRKREEIFYTYSGPL